MTIAFYCLCIYTDATQLTVSGQCPVELNHNNLMNPLWLQISVMAEGGLGGKFNVPPAAREALQKEYARLREPQPTQEIEHE